jgi:hypothetical protein
METLKQKFIGHIFRKALHPLEPQRRNINFLEKNNFTDLEPVILLKMYCNSVEGCGSLGMYKKKCEISFCPIFKFFITAYCVCCRHGHD